jgi:hypothetical protein
MEMFRAANRPLTLREDIRYLPTLVFRTWAVAAPVLVVIAAIALRIAQPDSGITRFLLEGAVISAVFPAFIAGFLAPRASYFAGMIVGLAAVLGGAALAFSRPEVIPIEPIPPADQAAFILSSVFLSVPVAGLYAAAAAWYRRFLRLSSEQRQRRQSQAGRAKPKPATRRR